MTSTQLKIKAVLGELIQRETGLTIEVSYQPIGAREG